VLVFEGVAFCVVIGLKINIAEVLVTNAHSERLLVDRNCPNGRWQKVNPARACGKYASANEGKLLESAQPSARHPSVKTPSSSREVLAILFNIVSAIFAHSALWPFFQCCFWQARSQYWTDWQFEFEQRSSLWRILPQLEHSLLFCVLRVVMPFR
jgi:hypothetical protein